MIDGVELQNLQEKSKNIRKSIVEMVYSAASGHPGGSLSITDVFTVLYFKELNIDVNNQKDANRDRVVLSKGHCSPALYSTLAEKGFFPKEDLNTFRKVDSYLQGHPDMKKIPGVDMTSGSLGQGLSIANGMALAGKLDNKEYRVYCICGDGEIQEGQIWEAAMSSSHYKLDNLCVIVDNNNLQIDGSVENVMNPHPIDKKFESFGFNVLVIDGHNFEEILDAFEKAKQTKGKPTAIIAKTIKGKGVSFMENQAGWHGKAPKEEEYKIAMEELSK
ncbi:MAG: transketolase [Clostridia bacterium]|nr:transketolase [Clostridia bacterium]